MEIIKFKTDKILFHEVLGLLQKEIKSNVDRRYENVGSHSAIVAAEYHYFRNNSTQANIAVIRVIDDVLFIDIMGMAGGAGWLGFDLGSEQSFVSKMKTRLEDFCKTRNCSVERIS